MGGTREALDFFFFLGGGEEIPIDISKKKISPKMADTGKKSVKSVYFFLAGNNLYSTENTTKPH